MTASVRPVLGECTEPLSHEQEQVWFFESLWPGSCAYNIPGSLRISGSVEPDRLRRCLDELVRRHAALRIVIAGEGGKTLQRVLPHGAVEMEEVDLRERWDEIGDAGLAALARAEAQRPFDLRHGPLFRFRLWQLGASDSLLQLTVHHLAADGWSMWTLAGELFALYDAAGGHPVRRRTPRWATASYVDLCARDRSSRKRDPADDALSYWTDTLQGAQHLLPLPTDRPRPSMQSHRGSAVHGALSSELCDGLRERCAAAGITLFQTILTAFHIVVTRYAGEDEAVVGFVDANRTHRTKDVVGPFARALPLRLSWRGNPSVAQAFDLARTRVREVLKHAAPLSRIVEALGLHTTISHTPVFQVVVAHEREPSFESRHAALRMRYALVDYDKAKFDLALFVVERGGACSITLQYCTDLFDEATALRIRDSLHTVLEACVREPATGVMDLPLMGEDEARRIVVDWNQTDVSYPLATPLHRLFEEQARRSPRSIALEARTPTGTWCALSYAELDGRADDLARRLRAAGVGAEALVGVFAPRSLELVVGMLGILKAGGAYVPLDPDLPRERIRYMVEDAELRWIVARADEAAELTSRAEVIELDAASAVDLAGPGIQPGSAADADGAAYMMYTSGSTGGPKGVVITHAAVCNRLHWARETFGIGPSDVVLHKTPIGFDVSVWELVLPLISGARLVLAEPGGHRDPQYLVDLIREKRVTVVHFVPSMLRHFLDARGVEACAASLRSVICSGEALSPPLQEAFFSRLNVPLYNLYGPTEAAIDVTSWRCETAAGQHVVPIGRPIANTQIYILDDRMRPVAVGVEGELHIGGANVARGYWRREELTRRVFVPDPFRPGDGRRLYKSGDRARFRSDGNVEFLGRRDHQVKVHGRRVELGEIEQAIESAPGVRKATVVVWDDEADQKLVAYVVGNRQTSPADLRTRIGTSLPSYMVPAVLQYVDAIPLTSSGKVDRARLPIPDTSRREIGTDFVAPGTDVELRLAEIWRDVLGVARVGVHDSFFELGGDSIRAIQMVSLASEFGIRCVVADVFRLQTIARLAAASRPEEPAEQPKRMGRFALLGAADRARVPDDVEDAYPMSAVQVGLVFHSLEGGTGYSAYVTSLQVRARLDRSAFDSSLRAIAERHEILRTSFDLARYSVPMQLVRRNAAVVVEYGDWEGLSEADQQVRVRTLIDDRREQRFDWSEPSLVRFHVHRRSPSSFQLTVVEAILDGWSVTQLLADLLSLYRERLEGRDPVPQRLATGCSDFVGLEQTELESLESRTFWEEELAGCVTSLLSDLPGEARRGGWSRRTAEVPAEIVAELERIGRSLGVPLRTVLLAAHLRVVGMLTGSSSVVTGVISNGRPEVRDGDRIVGNFLNTVPFTLELDAGSWNDLVLRVFRNEVRLSPRRRYPLARLQRTHGGPLFDTAFNYIHFYPYEALASETLEVLDVQATDQTYFRMTVQFANDWRSGALLVKLDLNDEASLAPSGDRLVGYYLAALREMSRAPERPYLESDLLDADERRRLIARGIDTAWEEEATEPLWALFERQVVARPRAIAASDGVRSLSYQDLAGRAEHAARRFSEVPIGGVVAILAERSVDYLAALLGMMKAGVAYLPLDPEWPAQRMRTVLESSGAALLVRDTESAPKVDAILAGLASPAPTQLALDALFESSSGAGSRHGERCCGPDGLSYVIYTSGSTGAPKGAMVKHRGMLNHLRAKIETLGLSQDSVVAQTASQAFDISVWQLLAALLVGGRTEIIESEAARVPGRLGAAVSDRGLTILEVVPALLRAILGELQQGHLRPETFSSLRWLVVTGEAFPSDLLALWFSIFSFIPVVNAYGPTECSDDVTHLVVTEPPERCGATVPIGGPIRNTRIMILDDHGMLSPVGVAGELVVGGVGVGAGYLNDERSAASFAPAPAHLTDSSLPPLHYFTGDRARILPDGQIEFLGRRDHQVKVRGFRVELQEIEHAVRGLEMVADAAVKLCAGEAGESLVAYVVPRSGPIDGGLWRTQLRRALPEYMIPDRWVGLPRLPVNANGKLDRDALGCPAPGASRSKPYRPPRNRLEREVARLWEEILQVDRIGIDDEFLDLGGSSLHAIRLVSKLSLDLDYQASTRFFLTHPSVAMLTEAIGRDRELRGESRLRTGARDPETRTVQPGRNGRGAQARLADLPRVDAAALGYWPRSFLERSGLSRAAFIELVDGPVLRRVFSVDGLGRIGHITLSLISDELYEDGGRIDQRVAEAIRFAEALGASVVSLTGLIPSATDYGRRLGGAIDASPSGGARITTGHATTASAVVLQVQHVLERVGRALPGEHLGVLGSGSIGLSCLRLLLKALPHPGAITLCDVFERADVLERVKRELAADFHFRGEIAVLAGGPSERVRLPDVTLVLGATNVPDVLDVESLRPGAILVDDSAPHCFSVEAAMTRLTRRCDLLFTEGGIVKAPSEITVTPCLPERLTALPLDALVSFRTNDAEIMGCILSSLLTARIPSAAPTIGVPTLDETLAHYQALRACGYRGAELSILDRTLPSESIDEFILRFGSA